MRTSERPISAVPRFVLIALFVLFGLQISQRTLLHRTTSVQPAPLPKPPSLAFMQLVAIGEPEVLSRLSVLWLQAFDRQPGISIPFDDLDYVRLVGWLETSINLAPKSQYPMFIASHLYSRVNNPSKQRAMIAFLEQQFIRDPEYRWRWLAQAIIIAQHRLNDLNLARRLAKLLRKSTTNKHIPHWAKQMELGIMEAQGEYQSAALLIGGLLQGGQITDPHELNFLNLRLTELKSKIYSVDLNGPKRSER